VRARKSDWLVERLIAIGRATRGLAYFAFITPLHTFLCSVIAEENSSNG